MTLELSAEEVLTTTRSVRRRLNLEKEVSVEVLSDCLDIALQAPTGSLRQDWHFVVSTDKDQCREVGTIYKEVWTAMVTDEYLDASASKQVEESDRASWLNMMGSARHLAEIFPDVPAIFVPCITGRLEGTDAMTQAVKWGSVIQAAWSFMLAARNRGLGTCWTTVHLQREQEVADILGIPFATVQQVALSPVAHTLGTDFKAGRRKASEDFVHFNGW